ncbi:GNAT family N-acetyltransferase [Bacillus sp. EB01]|uniref:GNAT family N-acetyltransferase n=1 Tax=Bacillus sp. EB01 TaxID=1347086 RepID=UPI0005C56064|nr:GNAT family N-acetyltransferase [Bacillus sp. EB01]
MLEIKRLTECTYDQALTAWNTGFEGYFVNLNMTHEMFLRRFPMENLKPSLSVAAFFDGEPAGLIVNGIRLINGTKIAWNGGTAVATKFRKQGVGRALINATLDIYKQEGVELAMLEAITGNDKAIALYESVGYEIVDNLEYLELAGKLTENPIAHNSTYRLRKAYPIQAGLLPFYKGENPWQTHWQSARDAEAVILADGNGRDAGYAYFRKAFNEKGKHIATTIYQCESDETRADSREIIQALVNYCFGPFDDDIRRVVLNLPLEKSKLPHEVLKKIGFKPFVNQVMMNKKMV